MLTNDFDSMKKRLNVDSPSFKPATQAVRALDTNGIASKAFGLSPKAANAAPFEPKGFMQGAGKIFQVVCMTSN